MLKGHPFDVLPRTCHSLSVKVASEYTANLASADHSVWQSFSLMEDTVVEAIESISTKEKCRFIWVWASSILTGALLW